MYTLCTEASFDGAHFLYGYEGGCANIHGHRFRMEARIESDSPNGGMVVDFAVFKRDLKKIAGVFDHAFIYEKGTLKSGTETALNGEGFRLVAVEFRPTAENFAKHFYYRLKDMNYPVKMVTVYETPENSAGFYEN